MSPREMYREEGNNPKGSTHHQCAHVGPGMTCPGAPVQVAGRPHACPGVVVASPRGLRAVHGRVHVTVRVGVVRGHCVIQLEAVNDPV
jgi:hypothetical protein